MEIVLFTLVAAILYFFSDWLLRLLEQKSGVPFKHRNIIFFIIISPIDQLLHENLIHSEEYYKYLLVKRLTKRFFSDYVFQKS